MFTASPTTPMCPAAASKSSPAADWVTRPTSRPAACNMLSLAATPTTPKFIRAARKSFRTAASRSKPMSTPGGLPTGSQGHCGAVTPQGGGALSALFLECSAVLVPSTAQERGAPLRYAPFGVTSTARGALPGGRLGRRDGRCGRTKGWDEDQAATASRACSGSKVVWLLSMAQATASRRSATLRRARPWL